MGESGHLTIFEKIWDEHVVQAEPDGTCLLYIDRHLINEGCSPFGFEALRSSGRRVRRPDATVAVVDHVISTGRRDVLAADPESLEMIGVLEENCRDFGIRHIGPRDPLQGIVHVVGPELGFTLPGLTLICGDSHTTTHGALGALAFGVGATEVEQVLATQTLWRKKPRTMRVTVDGELGLGVVAKDLALAIVGRVGASGGNGHVVEYAGGAVSALSVEGRMTLCNMTIEMGARAGLVSPDRKTLDYLRGREMAPSGELWAAAERAWARLPSDPLATFDREISLSASEVAPQVTWGTSPQDTVAITGKVPDPGLEPDAARRAAMARSLEYMDLQPGTPLEGIRIDRVFIGSCTNARIEDLRAAAAVVRGRRAAPHVSAMVVPGSTTVKRQAEAEGLDRDFVSAGFEWRNSGCSMCLAMNEDRLAPGERCAATSNRNFEGRQGAGGRTHLMSPAMAAAAAVAGRLADARRMDRIDAAS